jgi:Rod binding domain-containing protein
MTESSPIQHAKHLAMKRPKPAAHTRHGRTHRSAGLDPQSKHRDVTEQAAKWVAQTFYGQLLKQMHNSPFKNPKFEGGKGGEAFGQMFDQQIADKMSRGVGRKLVNSLAKKIEGKRAYDLATKGQNTAEA